MADHFQSANFRDYASDYPLNLSLVAQAIMANTNCVRPIAEMAILAAASAAAQDGFVIESPLGGIKPLSLLFCLSAPSGTGKSTALRLAMKSIHEHEKRNKRDQEEAFSEYKRLSAVHTQRVKRLHTKLAKAKESEISSLEAQLEELTKNEPIRPKAYRRMVSNTTIEGLFKHYDESCYSPFVEADEGRHAMTLLMNERAPQLCKLYDGDDLSTMRSSAKSYDIESPKISGIFMLQPEILTDYVEHHGSKSLSSGIWARILAAQVDGYKIIEHYDPDEQHQREFGRYDERLNQILTMTDSVVRGESQVHTLKMSAYAIRVWRGYVEECRQYRSNNPQISDGTHAYISRAPENLLRLAGLFHLLFSADLEAEIQWDTMCQAKNQIEKYVNEHVYMFENGGLDPEMIAGKKLLKQITTKIPPGVYFSKSAIHNIAPRHYRGKSKSLENAIANLIQHSMIESYIIPPSTPTGKTITAYMHRHIYPYA